MYIKRKIDDYLLKWAGDSSRKPLVIRGVRQCGKTSAVRKLAESFESYIEINLDKSPRYRDIFDGEMDINQIMSEIEIVSGTRVISGKTLIFIDEIQEEPRAIATLRYFYEDRPDIHVIAAGSLLEVVLNGRKGNKVIDFPVGRVRSIYMYPFSFSEFLIGMGQDILYDHLTDEEKRPLDVIAHEKLLEFYKEFLVVGGMPEAVATYVDTHSLLECQRVHRDIVTSFLDDFEKYSGTIPANTIRRVFEFSIRNICSQTKASSAISGVSAYVFDECIRILRRSGLVYPVKASSCETLPLGASEKESNKKLIIFDSGVYLTERKLDVGELLASDVFDVINKGDVVEMQTGLEMIKACEPFRDTDLYYWYRQGANAEVDYITEKDNTVMPIEVKSSGKGSMQSMRSFLKTHPKTPYGIRVSLENYTEYDDIHVVPVYAAGLI